MWKGLIPKMERFSPSPISAILYFRQNQRKPVVLTYSQYHSQGKGLRLWGLLCRGNKGLAIRHGCDNTAEAFVAQASILYAILLPKEKIH